MLNEFASWYVDRLSEMVPRALSRRARGPVDALLVEPRPADVRLATRVGGRLTQMGEFPLDRGGLAAAVAAIAQSPKVRSSVVLTLPRGAILERVITLPLAADAGLRSVLNFEMDRYTPFGADEVHWDVAVIDRDREQQRLRARILLVTRATLEPARATLSDLGLTPIAVESTGLDGAPRTLPLVAPDPGRVRAERLRSRLAWGACGALAVAVVGVPFLRQSWEADMVEARIAAVRARVDEADVLRRRLQAQAAGHDAIATERIRLGEPLQALSALTELLPDDTYLTVLVLRARALEIDGQSASASRLIGLLSADPVIRDAAFAAPVTRGEDGADMFSIKAEVRS